MLRYLNMFVIIGLILIGVSLAGFATGDRFLMEPGQAQGGHLSLIYLGAGLLMILNGLVSIRLAPTHAPEAKKTVDERSADEVITNAKDGIVN